jgi:hypothetical protein
MEADGASLIQAVGFLAMAVYLLVKHVTDRKRKNTEAEAESPRPLLCGEHRGLVAWMKRIEDKLNTNTEKTSEVREAVKRIEGALGL